jgi:hypothetical protein
MKTLMSPKLHRLSWCVAATVAMMLATPAQANLITNGNFETGDFSGWTTGNNVAVAKLPYFGIAGSGYFASFNDADKTPNGSLLQSFATTVGQFYRLTFDYGVTEGGQTQSITAEVQNDSKMVLASLLSTLSTPTLSAFSVFFTADSATTTVYFSDVSTNPTISTDGALDNVSVSAVPEPASMALVAGALLALASTRRPSVRRPKL